VDPFVAWVTVAIVGLAGFTGWLVRWIIQHLESDLAYARRSSTRGTALAEKAVAEAEDRARG